MFMLHCLAIRLCNTKPNTLTRMGTLSGAAPSFVLEMLILCYKNSLMLTVVNLDQWSDYY